MGRHSVVARAARTGQGVPEVRAGYRPDVEGMRAVAVVAVVLYHASLPGVAGGYVGVDVFFVLSGFLITGLLWRDIAATGRVSFASFYARRARRLLPAAMLVLVVTVVASAYWLPPLQARSVDRDALAAAGYVANYRFAAVGTDYLSASEPPSPIQHYWSLGVEEQFYLVWPVVMLLAVLLWRRRRLLPAVTMLVLIGGASFAWSVHLTQTSPPWAFFSALTRAWELATGGLLALAAPALRRMPHVLAVALGWAGLFTVVWSCVALTGTTPFPGVAALAPVLGTAAVVAAGCTDTRVGAHVLLGRPPFQLAGRMSYAWYLWHWPVLILAPVAVGHPLHLAERLVAAGVSAALAYGTLVLVENPIRFSARLRFRPWRSLALGAALGAAALVTSLAVSVSLPSLTGHGPAARAIALGNIPVARPISHAKPQHPVVQVPPIEARVIAAVARSVSTRNVPPNVQPSLANAHIDKAEPFFDGCALSWTTVDQAPCAYADTSSPRTVMMFGDSHAAQWFPAFDAIAKADHWRLETLAKATCPPLELPVFSPYLGRDYTECTQWRKDVLARIKAERPTLVVLGVARHYSDLYHFTVGSPGWLNGITRMIHEIRAAGSNAVLIGPIPKPPTDVPTCLSAHLNDVPACDLSRGQTVNGANLRAEKAAAGAGHYLDVLPLFCTATRCPVIVGNNLVYRDDNHLTTSYVAWLAPVVATMLDSVLP